LKDDIIQIIKSNEPNVIQTYLKDYVLILKNKISESTYDLTTQSTLCPFITPSLETIDARLKEFIRLHHIDLCRTISYQIYKLKSQIHERDLFQQISSFDLNEEQV